MARSGLYKLDVKQARDALIAQGKHPSLDAVRIELGNTGSKTTIHKYLKELEAEDGGANGKKASVSESVLDLVERLSAQLQEDATAQIHDAQAQAATKEREYTEKLEAANQQIISRARKCRETVSRLEFTAPPRHASPAGAGTRRFPGQGSRRSRQRRIFPGPPSGLPPKNSRPRAQAGDF